MKIWRPPLRLLVVMATPSLAAWPGRQGHVEPACLDTYSSAHAFENLKQSAGPELIFLKLLIGREATLVRLRQELQGRYDVLYFVGHSYQAVDETFILLEDGSKMRRGIQLSALQLGQWLQTSGVRMVILSSCDSSDAAAAFSRMKHIDTVVGMQMEMPMITASVFDEAVINAMTAWQSIERCILHGRQQIQQVLHERTFEDPTWQVTDRPDWAVPVLFTRAHGLHPSFCLVSAGSYQVGLGDCALEDVNKMFVHQVPDFVRKWIRKPETIDLSAFRIGRWPVTNHQYRYFLEHFPSAPLPPGFVRESDTVRLNNGLVPSAPVVGVTWEEAHTYCCWSGGRLLQADEWEVAARGLDGRIFPWGDKFDQERCSATDNRSGGPESVFLHEKGVSPFGMEDACGNVFEWTATTNGYRGLVVGGSWREPSVLTLPSLRCPRDPDTRYPDIGFRCGM